MAPNSDEPKDAERPLPIAKPVAAAEFEYVEDGDFDFDDRPAKPRRMKGYIRILLIGMAVGFTGVIATALWLQPYTADGQPRTNATHTQLGLPQCSMIEMTGKPCPACGMTTSFALLTHGDPLNSLRANWVGTILCGSIILITPWLLVGAIRGRLLWVRNGELFTTILLTTLLALMLIRWTWILLS